MMKRTTKLIGLLLILSIAMTGCGREKDSENDTSSNNIPDISISSFEELGEYNLKEAVCFDDGIIRFYYDGNYFLPSYRDTDSELFYELRIQQADLRNTDKDIANGYFYYAPGKFQDSLDKIVASEEEYAFDGLPDDAEKTEYLTQTDNYRGYTYKYSIGSNTAMYAIMVVRNEDDGNGCYVAFVKSDMPEAIEKAKETFATIEIYGETEDTTLLSNSFKRSTDVYKIVPPTDKSNQSYSEKYSVENIEERANKESTIYYSEYKHELTVGESYTPEMYGEAVGSTLKFTAEDESVATVSQTGEITAVGEGLTYVAATTSDGNYASIYIKVVLPDTQEEVTSE